MAHRRIEGLREIESRYEAILCDVWGVAHNGVAARPGALRALSRFRERGGRVVFVTNAPRPSAEVERQFEALGVESRCYDAIVTSGDVTRVLIEAAERPFLHIGPQRDLRIFEGIEADFSGKERAACAICTGLEDDRSQTPEDYRELLSFLRSREVPMICANPDIVVEYDGRLLWCAGALARDYREMGGKTLVAGKPHRPIYERGMELIRQAAGVDVELGKVLAIGDGLATDAAGAARFGVDFLFVSRGIHAAEYGHPDAPDEARLGAFLDANGVSPVAWTLLLDW